MPPVLIDTNVLIYSYDFQDAGRRQQAVLVLGALQLTGSGRLSVQCLAEFASAATRRLAPKLTRAEALVQVEKWAQAFPVFPLTPPIILTAARGARDYQLPYYDAQLWATALLNQVPVIFSEDFSSGSSLEGVRLINPFAPQFKLADWQ
jgi:predicted nucleic acid-binding protein